jgi:hypothetical protein
MTRRGVNLLDLIPERTRTSRDEANGTVTVLIPRFGDSGVGRLLGKFIGKRLISLHLDEMGTAVWRLCDGRRSVYEIGGYLEKEFGDRVEPVYERLAVFLRHMKKAGIIDWRE